MSKIYSFFKQSNEDKIILIKALILLYVIRIMLWILPFSMIEKITSKLAIINKNKTPEVKKEKLTYAINVMSVYTPQATCLTRALAAQILLARYNYSSSIKIGVSKNESGFEAHAWLEAEDKIILGKSETEYVQIHNIGEKEVIE
ncbi:MAG: lasso peptide biosynthesis B2 protein [Methanobacterium sp.]